MNTNTNTNTYNTCCGPLEPLTADCDGQTTKKPQYYRAPIDVHENDEMFTIVADMPGATAEGIEISIEDNSLEITAKVHDRYTDLGRVLHKEYGIGDFHRRFRIGDGIDVASIEATCKSGILTVRLPKMATVEARTIEVRAE
jgi:HSP20 family protein